MILGMIMGYSYAYLTGAFREYESHKNPETQLNNAPILAESVEPLAATRQPEVTSLETVFVFEKLYKQCKHSKTQHRTANMEEVGVSQAELERLYPSWIIKEFSPSMVWLYNEIDGYCPGHYIIKENNGYIAIYRSLEDGEGIYLVHQTQVNTAFLDINTRNCIREGIAVDSLEQIEQLIENWDS
jgi:hypothetical protein